MSSPNSYADAQRARTYAKLEFARTYYLAYRDLPEIISQQVQGREAIDFGCGTGRSTRFLRELGFNAIGVDISADMLKIAREIDPPGDYRLTSENDFSQFDQAAFDLILSAFTFDNIPTLEKKLRLFTDLRSLLKSDGILINLVSSPEIYVNEWASFSTKDFPENRLAKTGDRVKIIITDTEDQRPVEDIVWQDEAYRDIYERVGFELVQTCKPLARGDEPYLWVNEIRIAPWVIYVLKKVVV